MKTDQPLRPASFAEHKLMTAILDGTYPPGSALPAERALAKEIGITRPTLRETMKRLSGEGWITIQQGKPTLVNDYWEKGGLSLLGTLAKYGEDLPEELIIHLLDVRANLMPAVAARAALYAPDALLEYLNSFDRSIENPETFAEFDWGLQVLMTKHSKNPVNMLILNDFSYIFKVLAVKYFNHPETRQASLTYYSLLTNAISSGDARIEPLVREAMEMSLELWESLYPENGGE
ncbi:MAG: GntR family transcriptional regulator [Calditrichaceae bacterium]